MQQTIVSVPNVTTHQDVEDTINHNANDSESRLASLEEGGGSSLTEVADEGALYALTGLTAGDQFKVLSDGTIREYRGALFTRPNIVINSTATTGNTTNVSGTYEHVGDDMFLRIDDPLSFAIYNVNNTVRLGYAPSGDGDYYDQFDASSHDLEDMSNTVWVANVGTLGDLNDEGSVVSVATSTKENWFNVTTNTIQSHNRLTGRILTGIHEGVHIAYSDGSGIIDKFIISTDDAVQAFNIDTTGVLGSDGLDIAGTMYKGTRRDWTGDQTESLLTIWYNPINYHHVKESNDGTKWEYYDDFSSTLCWTITKTQDNPALETGDWTNEGYGETGTPNGSDFTINREETEANWQQVSTPKTVEISYTGDGLSNNIYTNLEEVLVGYDLSKIAIDINIVVSGFEGLRSRSIKPTLMDASGLTLSGMDSTIGDAVAIDFSNDTFVNIRVPAGGLIRTGMIELNAGAMDYYHASLSGYTGGSGGLTGAIQGHNTALTSGSKHFKGYFSENNFLSTRMATVLSLYLGSFASYQGVKLTITPII